MEKYVKVHPKYMVVIPKEIRERAYVRLGDKLTARFSRGEIILAPTKEGNIEERIKAITKLRHIHKSNEKVPDEVILDPLEYAEPEDLQ